MAARSTPFRLTVPLSSTLELIDMVIIPLSEVSNLKSERRRPSNGIIVDLLGCLDDRLRRLNTCVLPQEIFFVRSKAVWG